MQRLTLSSALDKVGLSTSTLDCTLAGGLFNQCISSGLTVRRQDVLSFRLYGVCSTTAENLSLAALLLDDGFAIRAAAITSFHFYSAERQYHTPLEYGGQRLPIAQWTVMGAGRAILLREGPGPHITHVTTGKIVDKGIQDANNMRAATAPAAYDIIQAHFRDTGRRPSDYDLTVIGDLGSLDKEILLDLFHQDGIESKDLGDCDVLIYDAQIRDIHCDDSGYGCSAAMLTNFLLNGVRRDCWGHLLFCGIGALLSPTSTLQRRSIPSVYHTVIISTEQWGKIMEVFREYAYVLLCGGVLCLIGQLLIDKTKPTLARIPVLYMVSGVVLGELGLYKYAAEFGGAGTTISLISFGYLPTEGAAEAVDEMGIPGVLTGDVTVAADSTSAAAFFGWLMALIFKPKPKSR